MLCVPLCGGREGGGGEGSSMESTTKGIRPDTHKGKGISTLRGRGKLF